MAIAPNFDDISTSDGFIKATYRDEDRLYLNFASSLDADLPPLPADFTVQDSLGKNQVLSLEFRDTNIGSLIILILERALGDEPYSLRYSPTQWLMCTADSGDSIEAFEESFSPLSIDHLDESLRIKSDTSAVSRQDNTNQISVQASIIYACEFRIQLSLDVAVDVSIPLNPNDFRAELEDRWLQVTAVKYLKPRSDATPDILLELSEPMPPGQKVVVAYRSPRNRLRVADGSPIAYFSVESIVQVKLAKEQLDLSLEDEIEGTENLVSRPTDASSNQQAVLAAVTAEPSPVKSSSDKTSEKQAEKDSEPNLQLVDEMEKLVEGENDHLILQQFPSISGQWEAIESEEQARAAQAEKAIKNPELDIEFEEALAVNEASDTLDEEPVEAIEELEARARASIMGDSDDGTPEKENIAHLEQEENSPGEGDQNTEHESALEIEEIEYADAGSLASADSEKKSNPSKNAHKQAKESEQKFVEPVDEKESAAPISLEADEDDDNFASFDDIVASESPELPQLESEDILSENDVGDDNKIATASTSSSTAPPAKSPLVAKLIYLIPIMIVIWLVFVIGIYVATMVFDVGGSSDEAGELVPYSSVKREFCSMKSPDGSTYEGECLNGQRDGKGTYIWASGNRYEGGWLNGERHGQGVLSFASGAIYDGDFVNGREEGQGIMTWPNGARYEGAYQAGRFHGKGVYKSAFGDRYEGIFDQGSMTDNGACTPANGEPYPGPCKG